MLTNVVVLPSSRNELRFQRLLRDNVSVGLAKLRANESRLEQRHDLWEKMGVCPAL